MFNKEILNFKRIKTICHWAHETFIEVRFWRIKVDQKLWSKSIINKKKVAY